ncbi:MAG: adenylyl-sulfate kinase [Trichodesmium sp. St16_bin4-tuft]|nr:adenylyl-sulfate kinase [Trichodesmium sp. St4_bin8_1]MDE5072411.1 adenylyl-sulfate kinase [Trichodesmium sp. St5_bin8]MDE5077066.1 adenylyl-sulfate kinase [Trichodesmium sp. St2_bin6]MDE5092613.1 adenylyl-sulfate kinase [Trichodesmium sp. St18_bin3_1_1]MDE5099695.1 adenylyl-sulfate kinase [Trichodesmium sp. St16_bin4-tuft]MDE5104056.1 adenylyl-sulfate kinase [Trichodesmium sp. St19_bin2]MDT9340056.1 adenylyl-sulfate kinase [Trichodesmium erythraeum 21-75]
MTLVKTKKNQAKMEKGFILWFTGLSGAGKTTISKIVAEKLKQRGRKVEILDGDIVRENLSKGLTFSKADRDINIRRIGFVAHLLSRNGVVAITAAISPYKAVRNEIREMDENFIEVYINAPLEVCEQRDVKGLYGKARAGEIKNFTGIDDPYEPPNNPEITCCTDKESLDESVANVISSLEKLGYLV